MPLPAIINCNNCRLRRKTIGYITLFVSFIFFIFGLSGEDKILLAGVAFFLLMTTSIFLEVYIRGLRLTHNVILILVYSIGLIFLVFVWRTNITIDKKYLGVVLLFFVQCPFFGIICYYGSARVLRDSDPESASLIENHNDNDSEDQAPHETHSDDPDEAAISDVIVE